MNKTIMMTEAHHATVFYLLGEELKQELTGQAVEDKKNRHDERA